MKKSIITVIAAIACGFAASGQSLQSLEILPDAASLSTGGVTTVSTANGNATRTNSAAMAFYDGSIASSVSFGKWAPASSDNTFYSAGVFYKLGSKLAIGIDAAKYDDREYITTTEEGTPGAPFRPSDLTAGLGVSYLVTDNLAVGVTGRFANSSLAKDASGSAFAADLSLIWRKYALKAGASVRNLGTRISFGGDSYMIPLVASAGASYEISGVTAMLQADYHVAAAAFGAEAGAQYNFRDMLFARAGFHLGVGEAMPSFASLGLGVRFSAIGLDFCYLTGAKELSNSLLAGISIQF